MNVNPVLNDWFELSLFWNRCTFVNRLSEHVNNTSIQFVVCLNVHVAISIIKYCYVYCIGTVWLIFVAVTPNNAYTRTSHTRSHPHNMYHIHSNILRYCISILMIWWRNWNSIKWIYSCMLCGGGLQNVICSCIKWFFPKQR